jgi:hypothetical protein
MNRSGYDVQISDVFLGFEAAERFQPAGEFVCCHEVREIVAQLFLAV